MSNNNLSLCFGDRFPYTIIPAAFCRVAIARTAAGNDITANKR